MKTNIISTYLCDNTNDISYENKNDTHTSGS
jgi:hypothetical protein